MIKPAHTVDTSKMLSVERRFMHVSVEQLWELWTKKDRLEAWFGPDGFSVQIISMDTQSGGEIRYILRAVGPEQIRLARETGLPVSAECQLKVTETIRPQRLGFEMVIDSYPDISPYAVLTVVELTPTIDGSELRVYFDRMHDHEASERVVYCHASQLSRLVALLTPSHQAS